MVRRSPGELLSRTLPDAHARCWRTGTGIWTASAWCAGILLVAYVFATAYRRKIPGPARGRPGVRRGGRRSGAG